MAGKVGNQYSPFSIRITPEQRRMLNFLTDRWGCTKVDAFRLSLARCYQEELNADEREKTEQCYYKRARR